MASIKEIAKRINLSPVTVSVVLNGRAEELRISKATQEKVLQMAKELDYHPNISARRLRKSGASNAPVIAIFWATDINSFLLGRIFTGIQNCLMDGERKFEVIVQPYRKSELHKVKALMTEELFNGAILTSASDKDIRFLEENEIKVPVVVFNRTTPKYSTVCMNDYETGSKIARLFADRGHKNVGIILPDDHSKTMDKRKKGFMDIFDSMGMEIAPCNIQYAAETMEGGNIAAKKMIAGGRLPTAVFISLDTMAVGTLPAFHEAGIRIPEDLEIMTHGDNEHTRFSMPSLSCTILPVEKMAEASIDLMLNILKGAIVPPVSKVFDTPFIFRQSMPKGQK